MLYKRLTVVLTPYNDDVAQIMIAQLGEYGFDTFSETEVGFEAYAPAESLDGQYAEALNPVIPDIEVKCSVEDVEDQDWNKEWEENHFKPIVIANKCRIRSPQHEADPQMQYEIVINPQMSFGTGYHETTTMMMEYIMEQEMEGKAVLDMGCGTGILGILTSMRGSRSVDAVDIDEWSYNNTAENLGLNNIQNITPILGGAETLDGRGPYDIILANINRNILLRDMEKYASVLKSGGTIFFSGFYSEDVPLIVDKAGELGIYLQQTKDINNWNALRMKKR